MPRRVPLAAPPVMYLFSSRFDPRSLQLHTLIVSAASAGLVNEPSEEQRKRVRDLEKADKARRRLDQEKRKQVKRGRSKDGDWD